jgi:hypothetical protein
MMQVLFDGAFRKAQLVRDFLVRLRFADPINDLLLPEGERVLYSGHPDRGFGFAAGGADVLSPVCWKPIPTARTTPRGRSQRRVLGHFSRKHAASDKFQFLFLFAISAFFAFAMEASSDHVKVPSFGCENKHIANSVPTLAGGSVFGSNHLIYMYFDRIIGLRGINNVPSNFYTF